MNKDKRNINIKITMPALIMLLVTVLLTSGFTRSSNQKMTNDRDAFVQVENHDIVLEDNGFFGHLVADFEEPIIGKASEQTKLLVYEQEVVIQDTMSETGLFNLSCFDKSQEVALPGKGNYYTDLSKLAGNVSVDNDKRTVTVRIPHVTEETVCDLENMSAGEVEKGWLAFGDIDTSTEKHIVHSQEMYVEMQALLLSDKYMESADKAALKQVKYLLSSTVKEVDPRYGLIVEFAEEA